MKAIMLIAAIALYAFAVYMFCDAFWAVWHFPVKTVFDYTFLVVSAFLAAAVCGRLSD